MRRVRTKLKDLHPQSIKRKSSCVVAKNIFKFRVILLGCNKDTPVRNFEINKYVEGYQKNDPNIDK